MIQLTARYQLLTDDFDLVDQASDALMDALMSNPDILEPDVAVSLGEPSLEVWLVIATEDTFEAFRRGTEALALAFATAKIGGPGRTEFFAHRSLIGPDAQVRTELVPA